MDVTQKNGFAKSPYQYDCSFISWGNVQMYNPNAQGNFRGVYNWGGVNAQEPWYDGQPYGDTPGCQLQTNIDVAHDCATQILGKGWRLPSTEEFKELFDNVDFIDADGNIVTASTSVAGTDVDKRITMNGIVGLRLRSKINGNVIFFPSSGLGLGDAWYHHGADGYYWSSSWNSDRRARNFYFSSNGVYPRYTENRFAGFTIRPVMEPPTRKGGGGSSNNPPSQER